MEQNIERKKILLDIKNKKGKHQLYCLLSEISREQIVMIINYCLNKYSDDYNDALEFVVNNFKVLPLAQKEPKYKYIIGSNKPIVNHTVKQGVQYNLLKIINNSSLEDDNYRVILLPSNIEMLKINKLLDLIVRRSPDITADELTKMLSNNFGIDELIGNETIYIDINSDFDNKEVISREEIINIMMKAKNIDEATACGRIINFEIMSYLKNNIPKANEGGKKQL